MKKHLTLLIVDDDQDDRDLFLEAVKQINPSFKCLGISNGEEALAMLKGHHAVLPDFIFLDLNMPRMNGRQFFAEMKRDARLSNIPIIIYSTSRRQEDVAELKRYGALGFITKPKTFDEICHVISEVLSQKQIMAV